MVHSIMLRRHQASKWHVDRLALSSKISCGWLSSPVAKPHAHQQLFIRLIEKPV